MAAAAAVPRLVPFNCRWTINNGHPHCWMAILTLPCAMDPWEAAEAGAGRRTPRGVVAAGWRIDFLWFGGAALPCPAPPRPALPHPAPPRPAPPRLIFLD